MNSMKRQKDIKMKDEILRLVSTKYATGEEWRNNSRKKGKTEPKLKQCPAVDVTGDGSKVQSCKDTYCIGTWNVRSINPGKLEVVKWCEVIQSCLTLCDPMDCSLPGSSLRGILQARVLEWVAISSPGDLPNPGIEPGSPAFQADALTSEPPGKPPQSKKPSLIQTPGRLQR